MPERAFSTVIFEKENSVARVTLNRPAVLNAYSVQMRDDLWEVLNAIHQDPEVRAVLVCGNGRAFCAGADLTEFLTSPSPTVAREVRRQRDVYRLLRNVRVPTVAAIHGYCLGSGIEIALCCDIRIASSDATFSLPEAGLGFIPGAGATQLLPRTVTSARALRMILTGEWLDAAEARRIGLVSRVLAPSALPRATQGLLHRLTTNHAPTLTAIKQAVYRGLDMPLPKGLNLERQLASAVTSDRREV